MNGLDSKAAMVDEQVIAVRTIVFNGKEYPIREVVDPAGELWRFSRNRSRIGQVNKIS